MGIRPERLGPVAPLRTERKPVAGSPLADSRSERWHQRNREVSLPHAFAELETYGNLANLRRLADHTNDEFRGPLFADSDVYKVLEAAAWELGYEDHAKIREFYEATVTLIERAQAENGYLDSAFQDRPGFEPWSDFAQGHELYCLGHLIQAAVAAHRALDDDRLLEVCRRFIAHVHEQIGGDAHEEYCGHPLIETALIEYARTTGDQRATELAEKFLRRRGSGFIKDARFGSIYYQDDVSTQQTEIMRGHAVRALYLNMGVADLYMERGDARDRAALETQWNDLVTKRMYVTGGTGSRHQDEAFGDPFELPADRAYAETCAGIALFNWAWRMYLLSGEAQYLDTAERSFYNTVLAGISASGDGFTYSNPLQRRSDHISAREEEASQRLPWFSCACCPPNLMRTIGSIEHFVATRSDEAIEIAHFFPAQLHTGEVQLDLQSSYPEHGELAIKVREGASDLGLRVRVPHWASSRYSVHVNGQPTAVEVREGWLELAGVLNEGTEVRIEFDLEFREVRPPRRADAIRGTVAFMRGPVVYCAEGVDNTCDIDAVEVSANTLPAPAAAHTELGPLAHIAAAETPIDESTAMYLSPGPQPPARDVTVQLRPYATWGNQEIGSMRVWVPAASA